MKQSAIQPYTLQELESIPTVSQSWNADLKVQEDGLRVWLTRTSVEDGEPYNDKVSIERWDNHYGRWVTVEEYQGR